MCLTAGLFWAVLLAAPPFEAQCLLDAYPGVLCGFEGRESPVGSEVIACDGQRYPWDDGRQKSLWERFQGPDLEDVFVFQYPAVEDWPPAPRDDPGLIRFEPLLERLYGASARDVAARLVRGKWFGRTVRIAPNAAEPLRAVARELSKLPRRFRRYFTTTAGTFNWRPIHGTNLRSLHSYGVAIDVGIAYSDYWRWVRLKKGAPGPPPYRNRFPREVVEVFERHGFLWGGRWSWFDTMHFEYRPELLCARRVAAPEPAPRSPGVSDREAPAPR